MNWFWSKYIILTIIIFFISLATTIKGLPFILLFIYALVLIDKFSKQRQLAVTILGSGLLIDVLTGEFLGITSFFLLCFSYLFDWLSINYINLHSKLVLLLRVFFGVIFYYGYLYLWRLLISSVSNKSWVYPKLSSSNFLWLLLSLFISLLTSIILSYCVDFLFKNKK